MNTYFLDLKFIAVADDVTGPAEDREAALEAELENIIEHLADLENVIDPDLTARLSTGEVKFSLGVEAEAAPAALEAALSAVRTAIHACDGRTEGWEAIFRAVKQTIRIEDDEEGELDAFGSDDRVTV